MASEYRVVRHVALISVAFVLLSAAGSATAADPAAAIAVAGNRRVEADAIRSYFKPGDGGVLDQSRIDAAVKALYASGQFETITIGRDGGHLTVTVAEAPLIDCLQFEGNAHLKDKDLLNEIRSRPRGPFLRSTVQSDTVRLVEQYRRSGRYDARIEPKVISRPEGRVDLVFEIQEGRRSGVSAISFTGNSSFPDRRLRDVIKTRVSSVLTLLTAADLFDPDRIEADRDLLRRFYLADGFADARVTAADAAYRADQKGFAVTYRIDEGARYRFGPITVEAQAPDLDATAFRREVSLRQGDIYDATAVDKAIDALTMTAARSGHPFVSVRPRAERDRDAKTIGVAFVLEDGPHVYVERINVRGNAKTADAVIRRELELGEGDALNRWRIDRSERRLKRLGFFKSVKLTTEPGSAPDRAIIDVAVAEENTGEFNVSGGYSTADGWLGTVTVGDRNLFGSGQSARASVTYGEYTRGFELAFAQPYAAGTQLTLGETLFAKQTVPSSYQSYGMENYGAGFQLGAPLTDTIGIQGRYTLSRQSLSIGSALTDCSPANPPPGCYANGEASLPTKQAAAAGPVWTSAVGTTLAYNSLDNPRNPTSGVRAELKQDIAGLGGDAKYFKTTGDARYYQPVTGDIVGVARLQGGTLTPWSGGSVPLTSSFFGGPQLVRGFAPNGFGPRDLTAGTSMDNVGGTAYWGTSAELRSGIPYLPSDFGLKAAVFADAGSLWGYKGATSSSAFALADSSRLRSSLGAGLIWDSPFGALRVDYAYPTSKAPFDITRRLYFGAGGF